jgi:hypothetical protein
MGLTLLIAPLESILVCLKVLTEKFRRVELQKLHLSIPINIIHKHYEFLFSQDKDMIYFKNYLSDWALVAHAYNPKLLRRQRSGRLLFDAIPDK